MGEIKTYVHKKLIQESSQLLQSCPSMENQINKWIYSVNGVLLRKKKDNDSTDALNNIDESQKYNVE